MTEKRIGATGGKGARSRRKEARPAEIVEVALQCFLANGFEATKLEEVARQAGVAKGTVYVYFETKEHLFRSVVQHIIKNDFQSMTADARSFDGPVSDFVPLMFAKLISVSQGNVPSVGRLILRELDRIPDLARIWFEEVIAPFLNALESVLAQGQARGEIRPGDVRFQVLSLLGPIALGATLGNALEKLGHPPLDLDKLAKQHADIVLNGLIVPSPTKDKDENAR